TLDAMLAWFGPVGCDLIGDSVDFRVGGAYRLRLQTPEGEFIAAGDYREITPPEKLVFSWKWEDDEEWADVESLVTLHFHADGEETELTLTQAGFPVPESLGRHEHGWNGTFEKLDAVLAA
ncbi:MAG: SRPBCC family protein, partial [Roseimicrobium sp.]